MCVSVRPPLLIHFITHCMGATLKSYRCFCEFCENECPDRKEIPCRGENFQVHAILDHGEARVELVG